MGNKKYPPEILTAQRELPERTQLTGYLNMPIEHNSQLDALEFYEELVNYVVSCFILHDSLKFQQANVLFCTNCNNMSGHLEDRVSYRTHVLQAKQSIKLELLLWNMAYCRYYDAKEQHTGCKSKSLNDISAMLNAPYFLTIYADRTSVKVGIKVRTPVKIPENLDFNSMCETFR